jgi:hypothetical protein
MLPWTSLDDTSGTSRGSPSGGIITAAIASAEGALSSDAVNRWPAASGRIGERMVA